MIITLTPSPSVDLHYELNDFSLGEVNRANQLTVQAGGKGFNVSKILSSMGEKTTAIIPINQREKTFFITEAKVYGIKLDFLAVESPIRYNATLLSEGNTTKINAESGPWSESEENEISTRFKSRSRFSSFSVIGGSLPLGIPVEWIGKLVSASRKRTKIVVDVSGEVLAHAITAGPFLVKPNLREVEEILGRKLSTESEYQEACRELFSRGAKNVLLSLGEDGSLYFDGNNFWRVAGKKVEVVNTVGAGDALLAGFIGSYKHGISHALSVGTAWSEAVISSRVRNFANQIVKPDLSRVRLISGEKSNVR